MPGNSFGEYFTVTTFGESHGNAVGVIIDGIEPGLSIEQQDIQKELDRRRPGQSCFTTSRNEPDTAEIVSGIFEGRTTGTPLTIIIRNTDQKSDDYHALRSVFRPGHADSVYYQKYGIRDYRGGGRASGRETAARTAAGAAAKLVLRKYGIRITAYTAQLGPIRMKHFSREEIENNPLRCPDSHAAAEMADYLKRIQETGDSVGGIVACRCEHVPPGLGDPVFGKLDALISHAVVSIGSVKAIEFGKGFAAAGLRGSEMNDEMVSDASSRNFTYLTNNAGGILGGISTGEEIFFSCAVKPTPSISMRQKTVDSDGEDTTAAVTGRHDPCICPRIVPVIESMTAIVLADRIYAQFGRNGKNENKWREE